MFLQWLHNSEQTLHNLTKAVFMSRLKLSTHSCLWQWNSNSCSEIFSDRPCSNSHFSSYYCTVRTSHKWSVWASACQWSWVYISFSTASLTSSALCPAQSVFHVCAARIHLPLKNQRPAFLFSSAFPRKAQCAVGISAALARCGAGWYCNGYEQ